MPFTPMTRTLFSSIASLCRISALAFLSLLAAVSASGQDRDAAKPNVIVIMADDLGYGDVGCYGAKPENIATPRIDQLAAQGLRFTSGYCSAATCTPTRYSFLTGTYAFRKPGTGIAGPNSPSLIQPGTETLPSLLQQAGYQTAVVGKWHLGLGAPGKGPDWNGDLKPGPLEIGFDYSFLLPTTNDRVPQVYVENHRVLNLDPSDPLWVGHHKPSDDHKTGISHRDTLKMDWSHGHNSTIHNGISRIGFYTGGHAARFRDEDLADKWVEKSKEWITQQKDTPFFLFFASHDLHVPRMPHERFHGKSRTGFRGDAIVQLDWCVGEIVDHLEAEGLAEDTLILFCSDNGSVLDDGYKDGAVEKLHDHQPAGSYSGGKYRIQEGGTRTPFITYWPGTIEPGISEEVVCTIDLAASLASYLDIDIPKDGCLDSLDVMGALLGHTDAKGRSYLIQQDNGRQGPDSPMGFRKGDWKLQRMFADPASMRKSPPRDHPDYATPEYRYGLYDLATDPAEAKNLATTKPAVLKRMQAELQRLLDAGRSRPVTYEHTIGDHEPTQKPNVIYVLADDLGYGDLGCYGQQKLRTPHIDRLASEGMRFTDHYSGNTVCSPSRAVLMTGQHPGHVHCRGNGSENGAALDPDMICLPRLFKNAGYTTGAYGKWGLGYTHEDGAPNPLSHGFDHFSGWKSQGIAHTYYPSSIVRDGIETPLEEGTYIHDLIMADAFDFIKESAQSQQPFFCYIPTAVPHAAMHAPEELHDKWRKVYPQFDRITAKYGAPAGEPCPPVQNPVAGFAGMMENFDNQIGQMLELLVELGVDDDTLILFASDNGAHREGGHKPDFWDSNGPLRGLKRDLYEGGIRSPFLARWPGKIAAGETSDHISAFWDVLPTMAELVNQPTPEQSDGLSFLPTLLGKGKQREHDSIYHEFILAGNHSYTGRSIRFGKWKAVQNKDKQSGKMLPIELYDLSSDIGESKDLAHENPDQVKKAEELMEKAHRPISAQPKTSPSAKTQYPTTNGVAFTPKPHYPHFSWDKVPVTTMFADNDDLLNDQQIKKISSETTLVCIEKQHGKQTLGCAGLGLVHETKAFRKAAPGVKVLGYFNSALPYPFTRHTEMFTPEKIDAHPKLKSYLIADPETGEPVMSGNQYCLDSLNPEMRAWWVNSAANLVHEADADGILIDQMHGFGWLRPKDKRSAAANGVADMMEQLKARLGPDKLLVANNGAHIDRVFAVSDAFMFEHYKRDVTHTKERLLQDWQLMEKIADAGKICIYRFGAEPEPGTPLAETDDAGSRVRTKRDEFAELSKQQLEFYLALYLIGAQPYSWFQWNWEWHLDTGPLERYPEFHRPLGKPLGKYTRLSPDKWEFTRDFEHASVWVDTENWKAKIDWQSATPTPAELPKNHAAPTRQDVKYGDHPKQLINFWRVDSDRPLGVLLNIHGGGWMGGKKNQSIHSRDLKKGYHHESISYPLVNEGAVQPAMLDSALRAVQFLRSKAKEWNIDPQRIAVSGGSAGGCSSLLVALHDDVADPDSSDPVEHHSSRVVGAMVAGAQTTMDPFVIKERIGEKTFGNPMPYKPFGAETAEELMQNCQTYRELSARCSPITHLSADDPPLHLFYNVNREYPTTKSSNGIHSPIFGEIMLEACKEIGVECYLQYWEEDRPKPAVSREEFLQRLLVD